MNNPLYSVLGGTMPQFSDGGFSQMMAQLSQFRNSFRGDARAEVQRLLQSGQMSQQEYNTLGNMANQIMSMMR